MNTNKRILVGKIVAPQGIRGEVRVQTFTAKPSDFGTIGVFGDNIPQKSFHFVRALPNTNVIIARIDGTDNRNAAEILRGTELFVNRDDLPPTQDGEYYQADLVGMPVIRNNVEIGRIVCFQNFGAGDIMELDNGDMVSFKGAKVDMESKAIFVD
ncbi:MAG: 16S rRNA processing protein RimM [Alphaproteobacteria bacterium]|nr:16S rRNA processing protein RimM [Alphaproteobacteria bacterium]